jgi:hypothetical protein
MNVECDMGCVTHGCLECCRAEGLVSYSDGDKSCCRSFPVDSDLEALEDMADDPESQQM